MAVTGNFKGTTNPSFTIGKKGATVYQGTSAPSNGTGQSGDIYIYVNSGSSELLQNQNGTWQLITGGGGGSVSSITAGTGLTGGVITSTGTIAIGTTGVTAGTYQGLVINTLGQITSATNESYGTGSITSIIAGTGLTGGTITSTGTISIGTSGITAGTYQGIVFNALGQAISATNESYGTGSVTSVATNSSLTGGAITTTGTLGINLSNANTWSATQTFNATGTGLSVGSNAVIGSNLTINGSLLFSNNSLIQGFHSGVSISGITNNTSAPIFVIQNSTQTGWGTGNAALTIFDNNAVETLQNALDDGNGNAYFENTVHANNYVGFAYTIPGIINNNSGGTLLSSTLTSLFDSTFGSAQGDILYRTSGSWVILAAGTSGQYLKTGGTAGNPSWATVSDGTLPFTTVSDPSAIIINSTGGTAIATDARGAPILNGTAGSIHFDTAGEPQISTGAYNIFGINGGQVYIAGTDGTSQVTFNTHGAEINGTAFTINYLSTAGIVTNNASGVLASSTLTLLLDTIGSSQGDLLYRTSGSWTVLAPGTAGYVLSSGGTAGNPSWVSQAGGGTGTVTSIATGTGLTGGPITTSGTISMGTSGVTAGTYGNGSNVAQIVVDGLGRVTSAVNVATGTGSVTSVATNATLTGGPITSTGTLGINLNNANTWTAEQYFSANAAVGSGNYYLLNGSTDTNWRMGLGINAFTVATVGTATSIQIVTGGGTTGPDGFAVGQTGSNSSFEIIGHTGNAYFRSAVRMANYASGLASFDANGNISAVTIVAGTGLTGGTISSGGTIAIGTSGITAGTYQGIVFNALGQATSATNQSYGTGSVTLIATNNGITGGTITNTGTIGLATIVNNAILANTSGSTQIPVATTLTSLLDTIGSVQGDVLYRTAGSWTVLAPGTNGQFLQTQGPSGNIVWATAGSSGGGTVTQVNSGNGLTGGPINASGTLSANIIPGALLFSGSAMIVNDLMMTTLCGAL